MTPQERRESLEQIAQEVGRCTKCRLHQSRTNAVPGEGHPDTEVVFVGEGPGFNEDQQGRPFVGAAGGLLNELLKSIGWSREEVYITNVVKCRPPGNRDPAPDEIAACRPYLERQLKVLDPAVLVTLGRISTGALLPGARIGGSHGTIRPLDASTGAENALAYPMYHPAAAFRQGGIKETLQADIAGLPDALLESRMRRARAAEGQAAADRVGRAEAATAVPVTQEPGVTVPVGAKEPLAANGARPQESASEPSVAVRVGAEEVEVAELPPDEAPNPNQMSLF